MANVIEQFNSKILDLKSLIVLGGKSDQNSLSNNQIAKEIAENIKVTCDDFTPDSSIFSYFVATLLSKSEENSVFNFLKAIITPKFLKFDDVISILIESITLVINKCDIDISAYVSDIIELCLNIIKQDGLKSKRECGYVLLNIILEICVSKNYDVNSSVADILQFCHKYLESSGLKQIENSAVKNGFYQLMGTLCKNFPEKLTETKRNYGHLFATVLSLEVKSQVSSKSKAPVYAVLEGCFYGFDGVLSNFADFFDTNPRVTLNQIYDYSKVLCDPETQISRHGPRKAALLLLAHHPDLFKQFFCNEFELLHNYFHHWTMHQDKDLRNAGFRAVDALLKQISFCIVEIMSNKPNESKIMYKAFVDKFDLRFENAITLREVALAVKGFGYFVEPMKMFYGNDFVHKMCRSICNRALLLFTNSTDSLEQKMSYLPYFMESIANFLENLDQNNSGIINSMLGDVEITHLHFFQSFPFLDRKYYDSAKDICIKLLKSANRFDSSYTYRLVYQALIRVLSLPTQSAILFLQDTADHVNFNQKILNFKDYMPLWILLLRNSDNDSKIFDSFLKIYDELLHRLDFGSFPDTKEPDEDEEVENRRKIESNTDPDIFSNMVDFYRDLIPHTLKTSFSSLTSVFLPSIIQFAIRYPKICGFYKLLTFTLTTTKNFSLCEENNNSITSILKRFVEHTLVIMKSYKGDLLVSCLQFILSVHLSVVEPLLDLLSENLKFALKIGSNYLPLAETCLDALEIWNENLPFDTFLKLYQSILPDLEQYLSSEQVAVINKDRLLERLAQKSVKKKQKLNRDKTKYRKNDFDIDFDEKGDTATLYNVKYRILTLIGQMGGQANSPLIERNFDYITENCTKWQIENLLDFPICFNDMKPNINLDPFLPRLCLLALTSGDRRTKTAACEALHSVAIFALGKWSQSQFDESVRANFCRLFKKLLPTIMKLCCDVDEVPLKLFTLLFKQMIHWISGIKSNDKLEVNLLLDALFTAAENPDDPNLRDFSAKWLDEYLSWSIRQNRTENVDKFFLRLINVCRHNSSRKRLAACQIFNGIYRTFREYDDLIDKYLLELFVDYMLCLEKCQYEDSDGIVSVASERTIKHLERILMKKRVLLSKKEQSRITPRVLKDATVPSFVDWLFYNIGRTDEKFRRKCFELMLNLESKVSFRDRCRKESLHTLIDRFEGKFNDNNCGIHYKPIIFASNGQDSLDWLSFLLAALDCYFASIFDDLVSIDILFSKRHEMKIFDAIRCFFDNFQSSEENDFTQHLKYIESRMIARLKCTITVRLLQFNTCLLNKLPMDLIKEFENDDLVDDRLVILALNVLFDPESQGFDVACDRALSLNLNSVLENYFHALVKSCQVLPVRRMKLETFVDGIIQNPLYKMPPDVRKFVSGSSKKNIDKIGHVINGLKMLVKTKIVERSRLNVDCGVILRNCIDSDKNGDAICRKFVVDYLRLGFDFGLKIDEITKILIKSNRPSGSHPFSIGRQFFDNFREFIVDIFVKNPEDFICSLFSDVEIDSINYILETLVKSLTVLVKNDEMRKRHGKFVGESIFKYCSNLLYQYRQILFQNDTSLLAQWIDLFRLVGLLDSTLFWSIFENSHQVFDQYATLLREKSHTMSLKIKLLSILPLFSKAGDSRSLTLKNSLDALASNYFPLRSSEFFKGSGSSEEYVAAIRKFLLNLICRETTHIMQEEVAEFLKQHCSNLSITTFLNLLAVPFKIFWNENSDDYTLEHRSNVLEKFLMPMLQGASMEILKIFSLEKIGIFMEKVEQNFVKSDEILYSNLLISKLGVFNMLTIIYANLPLEVLKGEINERFLGQSSSDKTELIKKLLKVLPEARKEGKDDVTNRQKWLFRCAAHNCIVSILMATQTKINIFEGFVFKDLWELIAEPNKEYSFAIDYQNLPIKKKHALSLKRQQTDGTDSELERLMKNQGQTLQFLSTQFLSESSLKSELTQYDFTAASTSGSQLKSRKWKLESAEQRERSEIGMESSQSSSDEVIDIEIDDLNSHPCMDSMLSIVKFMTERKILNLETNDAEQLPVCIKMIFKLLENSQTPINVRLFIGRLIILSEKCFIGCSKSLFKPMLALFLEQSCGSSGLHNFRIDIIVTLLSWSERFTIEPSAANKQLCSEFLQYFLLYCSSENTAVVRRNMQILNLVLRLWSSELFVVDPKIVLDFLGAGKNSASDKMLAIGLQILAVLLKNNVDVRSSDEEITGRLFSKTFSCLDHNFIRLCKLSAEASGLLFKFLHVKGENYEKLQNYVENLFINIKLKNQSKFLACFCIFQRQFELLTSRVIKDVLAALPSVHGEYKNFCLEIIHDFVGTENAQEIFSEIKAKGLTSLLTMSDQSRQLWALRIISKVIDHLSIDQFSDVMPHLIPLTHHKDLECRSLLCSLLMRIFERFNNPDVREALIRFLSDPDPGLRQTIFNFWSHESRLSQNTLDRATKILSQIYCSGDVEEQFLCHANYLLLELSSKSPDFERSLFDKPLKDCQYSNLQISTTWRRRYASLRSGSVGSQILLAAGTAMGAVQLKSTLAPENVQFTPTQGAYDWMTGSFFNNTYADLNLSLDENSISTGIGNVSDNFSIKKYRNVTEAKNSFDDVPASQAIENELKYLRRRILKDQSKTSQMYAKIETKRRGIREKTQTEQKIAAEQNVTLYRNYRQGDFPDIQISFCNVIKPIQAVAQRDSILASLFFEALLTNIVEKGSKNAPDNTNIDLYRNIRLGLENILNSTTLYSKQMISAILTFCYKHTLNFVINAETIFNVCLNSQYEKFGIVLLEKYICQFSENNRGNARSTSPPAKKSKLIAGNDNESLENYWIQLFRLYKSIDEYDCVRVIFTDFLNTKRLTKLGLEKEKQCDYMEAVKIYTEALQEYSDELMADSQNEKNSLLEAEVEYWDESRLRCLSWLNDWETMVDITSRSIDSEGFNFSAVWEDDSLQQIFLPHLIRSQTKLIVHRGMTAKQSSDNNTVAFAKFLGESFRDGEKKHFLEENEAFSLATLSFMENEDEKCKFLCQKLVSKCLKDWSLSSFSDISFRKLLLQDAQRSCEFLHFLKYRKSVDSKNLKKLLNHWIERSPNYAEDDSFIWDDILVNRTLFNEETCSRAIGQDSTFKIDRGNEIKFISYSGEAKMRLQFVENCLQRNNYHVAFHQLNFVKQLLNLMTQINKNDQATVSVTYDYCHFYAKVQFLMLHRSGGNIFESENAHRLMNILSNTAKLATKRTDFQTLKADILSEISWLLLDASDHNSNNDSLSICLRQNLRKFCDKDENSDQSIDAWELVEKSFQIYTLNLENGTKLVNFCDQTLRRLENDDSVSTSHDLSLVHLAECMLETLMNNMQIGDLEARRLFPRILQVSELYPSVSERLENLESMPCWMFLSWIDYIISILHTPTGKRLWKLVGRLAMEYPNAIVGPLILKIHYLESVQNANNDVSSYINSILKNLESKEVMENFVSNVGLLRDPGLLFNDVLKLIDFNDESNEKIGFRREFGDVFSLDYACLGTSWKKISEELKPKLMVILGDKLDKSVSLQQSQALKDLIEKTAKELSNLNIKFRSLADYSAWLKDFDSSKYVLEIPGQYNINSKPDPSKHIFVEGFDDEVQVFQSLRKPRTLTMKGNDGVHYKFLIKVGEDLRQDQRLQRIFSEMNGFLSRDAVSKKLGCKVETYRIVPLSTNVGMIEMLENVESLKEFMIRSEPKRGYVRSFMTTAATQMIKNKFFGSAKPDFKAESYLESYENVPNQHVVQVFTKIQNSVGSGLLKRSVVNICQSPESFFTLRQQFVASYSTMCVAHYILGIGDRHLDNFLINYRTCTIVGIDFGYVFGTSVQILGVPELVPFRLTKQITDVVEPIGAKAFFQPQMTRCMKILRENSDSLMNILDVFVKEPTINWMHEARKQSIQMSIEGQDENCEPTFERDYSMNIQNIEHWYPKQKMQTVWRKFHGDNPTLILEEEINLSRKNQIVAEGRLFPVDKILNVIHNSGLSLRYPKLRLAPENQIECLINLATDPLILARMYIGWESWF